MAPVSTLHNAKRVVIQLVMIAQLVKLRRGLENHVNVILLVSVKHHVTHKNVRSAFLEMLLEASQHVETRA